MKKQITDIIGLKELRANTERYIRRVGEGDSFIVVRRSRPVFKLSPLEKKELDLAVMPVAVGASSDHRRGRIARLTLDFIDRYRTDLEVLAKE